MKINLTRRVIRDIIVTVSDVPVAIALTVEHRRAIKTSTDILIEHEGAIIAALPGTGDGVSTALTVAVANANLCAHQIVAAIQGCWR